MTRMIPRIYPVMALGLALALATPALTEEAAVLAVYKTNNCCLPPEYAMDVTVTIRADGKLTLTRCEGYATEPPGCKTRSGKVPQSALDAIVTAATDSGLAAKPAALNPDPPIGGGGTSGSVMLDGVEIILPWNPALEDAERVALVLSTVREAVPTRFSPLFEE